MSLSNQETLPILADAHRAQSPYPHKRSGKSKGYRKTGSAVKLVTGLAVLGWLGWHGSGGKSNPGAGSSNTTKHGGHKHGKGVKWEPCWENKNFLCGSLDVPTDYDDPSVGTTTLAMSKIPAKVPYSERKGSILVNYGGPGVPGRTAAFSFGDRIADVAPSYDIISWDGRGIGRTVPSINCHGTNSKAILALAGTTHETTFEVPPHPFDEAGTAVLVAQQKEALGLMEMQGNLCNATMGADVLKYMGTTTLIKDTERISAVLEGEDAPINGWSGSYGTIWTSYLINMLPHKVGRIVTYGVANPPLWTEGHYETYELLRELLTDAEYGYEWFLTDCMNAGPEHCPLAKDTDKSYKDLKARIATFLEDLYHEPMPVWDATRPGLLKSGMVRAFIFEGLQMVDTWPAIAADLHAAMQGNGTALRNRKARPAKDYPADPDGFVETGQADLQRLGVSCADSPPYEEGEALPTAEGMVAALQGILRDVSPTFGATVNLQEQHGGCQFWPKSDKPVHRFTGPWNHTLANTILVASNSHDPITPAVSGRDMANLFGDQARHVISDAPGHSYLTKPVGDFANMLMAFYENGTIPEAKETFYPDNTKRNFFLL